MAASMKRAVGHLSELLKSCHISADIAKAQWAVPVRCSHYNPKYMEPTRTRDELAKPLSEEDERRFRPIKAAHNDDNCSLTYDPLISKFVRLMIERGEKATARTVMDRTFARIKEIQLIKYHEAPDQETRNQIELNPTVLFHEAVKNCKPILRLQGVRRAGTMYKVPIPVSGNYQLFRSLKWLIEGAKTKPRQRRMWDALAREVIAAAEHEGAAIRLKQELNKLCEANRMYAHYRW